MAGQLLGVCERFTTHLKRIHSLITEGIIFITTFFKKDVKTSSNIKIFLKIKSPKSIIHIKEYRTNFYTLRSYLLIAGMVKDWLLSGRKRDSLDR